MALLRRQMLLACAALASGCRTAQKSGATIRRVVSLTPNTTEALFAIGAGSQVVGRSRYCDFPPEAMGLPVVGGYVDPSLEAILALSPDLVTGARGPSGASLVRVLEERGIRTYFPETETLDGIVRMIQGLAGLVGHALEAAAVVGGIEVGLGRVREAVSRLPHPRVLLVFGLSPVVAAGPGSFPDEMLHLAGCANVIAQGARYPTLSLEAVVALQPDLVLDAAVAEGHGKARISKDSTGWERMAAVREGRVYGIDDNTVLRPGPRVADGVKVIAKMAHAGLEIP